MEMGMLVRGQEGGCTWGCAVAGEVDLVSRQVGNKMGGMVQVRATEICQTVLDGCTSLSGLLLGHGEQCPHPSC